MSKKKKKANSKKKLTKQLTKQLKKAIKVHGPELALGFVTGLVTKLITGKSKAPKKSKKSKEAPNEEQPTLVNAVEETTKAVVDKVKDVITPKALAAQKEPVKRAPAEPIATAEANTETTA
jgi:hypothetical protein